jgi:7-cyano-7-deazaguanine synthase in queuosine biosynthesis
MTEKIVALISGGIDSTIMAFEFPEAQKVFINYGQPYAFEEFQTLKKIFGSFEEITLSGSDIQTEANGFIPNRNLCLASLVSMRFNPDKIFFAGLKDDLVEDKNPAAFEQMSVILTAFARKKVQVFSPYWNLTKGELVQNFLKTRPDAKAILQQTFSCYKPVQGKPCLDCSACFRRYVALATNSVAVPVVSKRMFLEYFTKFAKYDSSRASRILIAAKKVFHKVIAFDLDGVLCRESGAYPDRESFPERIEEVNQLFEQENLIVIYTARLEEDREETLHWLLKNQVKFHLLVLNKIPFDLLIDDRSKQP